MKNLISQIHLEHTPNPSQEGNNNLRMLIWKVNKTPLLRGEKHDSAGVCYIDFSISNI